MNLWGNVSETAEVFTWTCFPVTQQFYEKFSGLPRLPCTAGTAAPAKLGELSCKEVFKNSGLVQNATSVRPRVAPVPHQRNTHDSEEFIPENQTQIKILILIKYSYRYFILRFKSLTELAAPLVVLISTHFICFETSFLIILIKIFFYFQLDYRKSLL